MNVAALVAAVAFPSEFVLFSFCGISHVKSLMQIVDNCTQIVRCCEIWKGCTVLLPSCVCHCQPFTPNLPRICNPPLQVHCNIWIRCMVLWSSGPVSVRLLFSTCQTHTAVLLDMPAKMECLIVKVWLPSLWARWLWQWKEAWLRFCHVYDSLSLLASRGE